jgi:hypothetical protein
MAAAPSGEGASMVTMMVTVFLASEAEIVDSSTASSRSNSSKTRSKKPSRSA